jgi:release factor glutamine methyltransferase
MTLGGVPAMRARASNVLDAATLRLANAGVQTARLDAEVLLAEAAGVSRASLLTDSVDLSDAILRRFGAMVADRARRMPAAYIVGHREFYSLDFRVTPAVLIPRPETETVVTAALDLLSRHPVASVLDIGTGSGAIAIALAVYAPAIRVTATDISNDALDVARENARVHRVADRIEFRLADLFDPLDRGPRLERFDLIVSNPPYIDDAAISGLEPEVRDFEPRVALGAADHGLSVYRRIAAQSSNHLSASGEIIVEAGAGQADDIVQILASAGFRLVAVINDLAGIARVVHAKINSTIRAQINQA